MPTYDYKCEHCKRTFEEEQKITDPKLTSCPLATTRTVEERMRAFDDETGSLYGGNRHRDRCVCQREETGTFADTPHKHYAADPPLFPCARCDCSTYRPEVPETCGGPVKRLISGPASFVLKGGGWAKDGY